MAAITWLLLANVILFGVVRYISMSKLHKKNAGKVNWDGYDAVTLTIGVYLVSQFMAALIFGIILAIKGGDQVGELLSTSVTVQFLYIFAVETLTLGSLHWLLKMRGNNLKILGLSNPSWRDLWYVFIGLGLYIPLLLVALQLARILAPSVDFDQSQQIGFESAQSSIQLILVFLSLVVLPPVTEEIVVRGFLYLGLKKHLPKIWAVLITSVMFAIAHLQFGSNAPLLWTAAIDTFVLSLVLIYIRDATGKLWAPIGLHALKNCIAFMYLFVLAV